MQAGLTTKEGMKMLLNLKFAEPLPVVMARAKKTAASLSMHAALEHVAQPLSSEVHAFIQLHNTTAQHALTSSQGGGSAGLGSLQESAVFAKAMGFMNTELKAAQEKMDVKLFECGFFKLEKEGLLYETQDVLDEIAQDISLAEATIEKCQGEIGELSSELATKREELREHLYWCGQVRAVLEKEKSII